MKRRFKLKAKRDWTHTVQVDVKIESFQGYYTVGDMNRKRDRIYEVVFDALRTAGYGPMEIKEVRK